MCSHSTFLRSLKSDSVSSALLRCLWYLQIPPGRGAQTLNNAIFWIILYFLWYEQRRNRMWNPRQISGEPARAMQHVQEVTSHYAIPFCSPCDLTLRSEMISTTDLICVTGSNMLYEGYRSKDKRDKEVMGVGWWGEVEKCWIEKSCHLKEGDLG